METFFHLMVVTNVIILAKRVALTAGKVNVTDAKPLLPLTASFSYVSRYAVMEFVMK